MRRWMHRGGSARRAFGRSPSSPSRTARAAARRSPMPGRADARRFAWAAAKNPPPWGRARAALRYDEQARRVVLPLKFHDRTEYALALASMMARAGAALLGEAEMIVPVPLQPAPPDYPPLQPGRAAGTRPGRVVGRAACAGCPAAGTRHGAVGPVGRGRAGRGGGWRVRRAGGPARPDRGATRGFGRRCTNIGRDLQRLHPGVVGGRRRRG